MSACLVTCPNPLLKGSEGEARAAVYSLLCQSKYSGLEHEMGKDALQRLEKQLHLPWSFSTAASLTADCIYPPAGANVGRVIFIV